MNFTREKDGRGYSVLRLRSQSDDERQWICGFYAEQMSLTLVQVDDTTWEFTVVDVGDAAKSINPDDYANKNDADIETEAAEMGVEIAKDAPRDQKIKAHQKARARNTK